MANVTLDPRQQGNSSQNSGGRGRRTRIRLKANVETETKIDSATPVSSSSTQNAPAINANSPAPEPAPSAPSSYGNMQPAQSPYDSPGSQTSEPWGGSKNKSEDGPAETGRGDQNTGRADNQEATQSNNQSVPNTAQSNPNMGQSQPTAGTRESGEDDKNTSYGSQGASPNSGGGGESNDTTADPQKPGSQTSASDINESTYDTPGNQPSKADDAQPSGNSNPESEGKQSASPRENLAKEEAAAAGFNYSGGSGHENKVGKGYNKSPLAKNRLGFFGQRRALLGLISVALVGGLLSFGSFFSTFKLNGIMENVSARTFARLNGVEDRRSQAWTRAYIQMRLMDWGNNPDMTPGKEENALFRASRVNHGFTINQLALDWYRTLRTSSFEQDVFEKHGIKFTSVFTADGKVRPGIININGEKTMIEPGKDIPIADYEGIANGNIKVLNKYQAMLDTKVFANDKSARKEIKAVVDNNTHHWQVFQRRQIRKSIQNMTGVRNWRFFEKTRNKIDDSKIKIRNNIIAAAIPESTKSGKFVRCLFGISSCTFSEDPADPQNQSNRDLAGNSTTNPGDSVKEIDPSTGKTIDSKVVIDLQPAADMVKKVTADILQKAAPVINALNIVSTLDSLKGIDKAIQNNDISKSVAVARGIQAMGLYQVFQTASDQLKTGQVNGQQVNEFMKVIGPAASSEGYTKVIAGSGDGTPFTALGWPKSVNAAADPTKLTDSDKAKFYCTPENQAKLQKDPSLADKDPRFSFAYLCPDKQIGSSTNANKIQTAYNSSIGGVIHPLLTAYGKVRDIPLLGDLLSLANNMLGRLSGLATSTIKPILSALGISDDITKFMEYVTLKITAFLGAGPIMSGTEQAGVFINWVIQGGAYSAEASSRANGASLTTPQSMAESTLALNGYLQDKNSQTSVATKLFSLSNPDSLAYRASFAISDLSLSNISNRLVGFASGFGSIFGLAFHHAAAAAPSGYAASNFAGIHTFDFPSQCYGDPLLATPQSSTNIQQVLKDKNIPDSELTWDLVTNSDSWYQYVYSKTDNDSLAQQIYNCALLDTSIRGGLGNLYGYTSDNGLNDSAAPSAATQVAAGSVDMASLFNDSQSVACAPNTKDLGIQDGYHTGQLVKIRICSVPAVPSTSQESNGGFGVSGAGGGVVVNSRVSGAVYAMAQAAKASGVSLTATSGFRTMSHQQSLCPCDGVRVGLPGYSNHQMGLAIDFGDLPSTPGPVPGNTVWAWLSGNADKFGYKNYQAEAWHWSPTGN
ncbi:MAG: hypothetical protein JWO96_101 [Candidatus Saccharibacteria bacterium]|nr:hypothetical protein [Candidatus Saccharibacteria bacterium]